MSTSAPPIARALGRLAGSLYADHLERRPTQILVRGWWVACQCTDEEPDAACQVGQALWRMRRAELLRFDDGRRHR